MSENCESLRFVVVVCISQVTYAHVYIFASDFQDEFCLLFLCVCVPVISFVWFNRPFQGMHNQNHCSLTAGSGGTEMDGQQEGLKELKINPLKNASIFSLLFFRWMNDPPVDPSVDDDHSSLNELQAHHFDSSAVKASNSRPRDRGRPRASPLPTGSSKSFGKHCYKWNEDPNNCGGCNYTHACIVCDKDFILSCIAHGFHLVNDLSSISSADCTNYLSAENPAVKPALDRLFQAELRSHHIQAVPYKPLRVNAIGSVQKKDTGERRPITTVAH